MADEPRKRLTFDPTVHAGQLINAAVMVGTALGIWFGLINTVSNHTTELKQHAERMADIEARASAERERTDRKFDTLVHDNNEALGKLRDDMQGWFMALGDKLDRKADKR